MEIEPLLHRARAWARRQPRAVLIPVAFIAVVVLLSLVSAARRGLSRSEPEHPAVVAVAPATIVPPISAKKPSVTPQTASTESPKPDGSSLPAPTPVVARHAGLAAPVVVAQPSAPPAGISPGWVNSAAFQRDQFGQFAQISAANEHAHLTSFQSENPVRGGPDWAQEFQGWFKLAGPTSIAILRAAGGAGTAEASIDGQPLGQALQVASDPSSQTATLNLSSGWHTFRVRVGRGGFQNADAGIAVQVAFGDGNTPPAPMVPYAVPPSVSGVSSHPVDVNPPVPAPAPAVAASVAGAGHE